MPIVEAITIINKSGKVVSTSKQLVNIFKDAKEAYQEKRAEIKAEIIQKNEERAARKLLKNIQLEPVPSESSRRSQRHRSHSKEIEGPRRPELTERNLTAASEASVPSSRRSSRHGSERSPRTPRSHRSPVTYQSPSFENADASQPNLVRRHTDSPRMDQVAERSVYAPPRRSMSSPTIAEDIDMHLAYGDVPPPLPMQTYGANDKEVELQGLMSKLDKIMLEAQCIQHSASTIISSLQANPEAMAAVALTLAEISNLVSKMGPGVLVALKGGSPAVFALLASPHFLIGTGVAVGVTIVMFGGYKIIKKIKADAAERKEAARMDEALVYEGDLTSIDSWRRGIAEEEARSVGTSVDGEFITPEAQRLRKAKIRERAREERNHRAESVAESNASTIKPRRSQAPSSVARSETVRSESTVRPKKEVKEKKEKKAKKPSALTVLFKKSQKVEEKKGKSKDDQSERSHRPARVLEL